MSVCVFVIKIQIFQSQFWSEARNNASIMAEMVSCQDEVHAWGEANQVVFDKNKESFHILSRNQGEGRGFPLLGVFFDIKLDMCEEINRIVAKCFSACVMQKVSRFCESV